MNVEVLVKVGLIICGIVLFLYTIKCLAKRTITESFSLLWGMLSVILILAGILLHPAGLEQYISRKGIILVGLTGILVLMGLYYFSIKISILQRKNQELAMHISLLNQENEQILKKLEQL